MREWINGRWIWKLDWKRQWFNWEQPIFDGFLKMLNSKRLYPQEKDKLVWKGCVSSSFLISNMYRLLRSYQGEEDTQSIFKDLWSIAIPSNVTFVG